MKEIEQGYLPEISRDRLDEINRHLESLTSLEISQPPVILSGSAVYLYELANRQGLNPEDMRIPTDLDVVLTYEDFLRILKSKDTLGLQLRGDIRNTKWGLQYHNWLLEGDGQFPLDIMMILNTLYPDGHKFYPEKYTLFLILVNFPI